MSLGHDIRSFFKGRFWENEPMAERTWYKIGGPCDVYCMPADVEDLTNLAEFCGSKNVPYFVHGKGSNLLISDAGIRGVVIDLETACSFTEFENASVTAGAGVYMPKLVLECERRGLGGIEMFAGIPGTIGGTIKMNAGCHGQEMFDVLTEVRTLEEGRVVTRKKHEIAFAYRHVKTFDDPRTVILGGTLALKNEKGPELAERRKKYMEKRRLTQPIHLPSSGSVFKNPAGDHAARLIEKAGLKSYRIGKASVSDKHANFIVNEGGAKADDVLRIVRHVRDTVSSKFGVNLELEVKLIGFDQTL